MMNTILSILVCIAMLCSGTGALPAQPETAVTWTLRNVTIDMNGEQVTLAPEARITTAIGAEKAQIHFELANGEDVLMPVSGELTPEDARFTLGGGERAYAVTDETLIDLMDLDEEDAQALELVTGLFADYCALLSRMVSDEAFAVESSTAVLQAMIDACGAEVEDTEVEIDGERYPAQHIMLDFDLQSALGMLDNLRACGVSDVEALMEDLIELCALAMDDEMEFTSFADLTEDLGDVDASYPVELTIAAQDELSYSCMDYAMNIEDEMLMEMSMESIARGEETEMNIAVTVDADDNQINYAVGMEMTGPANAPEKVNAVIAMEQFSSYSYTSDETDDNGETVEHLNRSDNSTSMLMNMYTECVDGLEKSELSMSMSNANAWYTDDEEDYSYESTMLMEGGSQDRVEADGSVTTATSLRMDADGETIELSFDLNRAEGAAVDFFEGLETCALTADMDEESPAYGLLTTDAMNFAADAMQLTADDSVIALMEMLGMDTVESDDDDITYEPVESTVSSFEEAEGIFEGTIPAFDAPEGFTLDGIEVDEYSLTADYSSEAGRFSLSAYAYGADGLEYFEMKDGALRPADCMVELCSYDGESVDSATVYTSEGTLYFYFDLEDASREAVEVILAGLNG